MSVVVGERAQTHTHELLNTFLAFNSSKNTMTTKNTIENDNKKLSATPCIDINAC